MNNLERKNGRRPNRKHRIRSKQQLCDEHATHLKCTGWPRLLLGRNTRKIVLEERHERGESVPADRWPDSGFALTNKEKGALSCLAPQLEHQNMVMKGDLMQG